MNIENHIPLLEEILDEWKARIGKDYAGYKNHVYRMVNFSFALNNSSDEKERQKIIIAGCFHDIGIWTGKTFDYLPPSIVSAKEYLNKTGFERLLPEIELMIGMHHKLRSYKDDAQPAIEAFRQGDLVDFSLGLVKCGLPKDFIKSVKKQFPNAGFHKRLVTLAGGWICRHPLNPVPVLKW